MTWMTRTLPPALLTSLAAKLRVLVPSGNQPPRRLHVYWALMTASIVLFIVQTLAGASLGLAQTPVAIGCAAGCGWSWLLARALFQPAEREPVWPLAIVLTLFATGAVLIIAGESASDAHPLLRMAANVQVLTSSTVLLLGWLEALNGYGPHLPRPERRFRLIFAAVYGGMVAIAVLWSRQSPEGAAAAHWNDTVDLTCAVIALIGARLAVGFRDANPLPRHPPRPRAERARTQASDADTARLAAAILRVVRDEEAFATPELKVADLSRLVGEANYKVTRCVTGALGFRNFNHMVNHFRIARAKRMLADPASDDASILEIAMDCGFGSVGPFNRAFKAEADVTPREFRAAARPKG